MARCHYVLCLLLASATLASVGATTQPFKIGGILDSNQTREHFRNELERIVTNGESGDSASVIKSLHEVSMILQSNPVTTATQVCDAVIAQGVCTIVAASPSGGILSTVAISYIGSFYQVPVICTHSRDSAFSDQNIHGFFLRTVPPLSHQADVWITLLKHFNYNQVIFMHSSDTNGRAIQSRFQYLAHPSHDDDGIRLSLVIEFNRGQYAFVEELNIVKAQVVKVILLYADIDDAETIFHDASYLNMTGPGYVWLVTEQALGAHFIPVGVLGLQLKNARDSHAHITDALQVTVQGIRQLYEQEEDISTPAISWNEKESWDDTGKKLYKSIRKQVLYNGRTGKVGFDSSGDRIFAEYSVINVLEKSRYPYALNTFQTVGDFSYDNVTDQMKLSIENSAIIWPGKVKDVPLGFTLPTHFKVMTLRELPFVYAEAIDSLDQCREKDEVLCPYFNRTTNETQLSCCWGYCIDLLLTLSAKNNFTFEVELSSDGHYGEYAVNEQGKKEWNGMIGELVAEENGIDMIVAPLTINPERSNAIAFSKPFKYQGITILVKRAPHEATLVSILQPFRDTLWLMLLATVHVIAILMWVLDRLSPVYKITGDDTDSLSFTESFWFSWAVILNSGLSEGTPRCISGRILGIIWGGFAMIIVASYTANLAAFLVLETPATSISGINDPRLRNPGENFTFATIKGSAVNMFFQRKTEWSNMYRVMEMHNYDSVDDALQAVRDGTLQAFIWESSRLEYEAAQDCDLLTVGELFGRSGYGLGLKKGSPWAEKITRDILDLHERGYMEELDKAWIWASDVRCPGDLVGGDYSKRLGLKNLEGIFIMVAGAVLSGVVLVVAEITYNRCHVAKKKKKKKEKKSGDDSKKSDESDGDDGGVAEVSKSEAEVNVVNLLVAKGPQDETGSKQGTSSCAAPGKKHAGHEKGTCTSEDDTQKKFLDASKPNDRLLLHDIENRLRESPNIPEEWKKRSPVEWFQYYLDILRQDADISSCEKSSEAVAIMEGFVDFVQEIGIKDFSELYSDDCDSDDSRESGSAKSVDVELQNKESSTECAVHGTALEKFCVAPPSELELNSTGDTGRDQTLSVNAAQRSPHPPQQTKNLPDVLDISGKRRTDKNGEGFE
ncbi:glutamate [NMDA] receptor subunit 1-like [Macrobrachium rosenbergii]|uniref:glutamate [NMDA] receptor subunit 1-like n=1 Tax=Macrobrachium rosenbergii TaxID=79674 RepID=UPI0034D6469C